MKCPNCLVAFHDEFQSLNLNPGDALSDSWQVEWCNCPACNNRIIFICYQIGVGPTANYSRVLVCPKGIARSPIPSEVPERYASDFKEACLTLSDSPKASAALSRRCLQNILRDEAKVKKADLSKEIDEVLSSKQLPTYLADSVDAIRNLGNFAAHPTKSTNTGMIVDVESGEAEWLLDVLEGLFDFYFIQPIQLRKKRDMLNKKLADAGKPPMKETSP